MLCLIIFQTDVGSITNGNMTGIYYNEIDVFQRLYFELFAAILSIINDDSKSNMQQGLPEITNVSANPHSV